MKKAQKALRETAKLKQALKHIENGVAKAKDSGLWHHEAAVRRRLRALRGLADRQHKDYNEVYEGYLRVFDNISVRLLEHYNKKHSTAYRFEDIVTRDRDVYLSSGIIAVLITSHIPRLVADQFTRVFPANPKDEYTRARAIKRRVILHLGETNTGKTYKAVERLKQAKNGVYLAPLRILALENYEKLNTEGVPCNLITGEEELLTDNASHVCSTIEKLDIGREYDVAVIDEIQMIANSQRGQAWTRALLGIVCGELHVCGAINVKKLVVSILQDCGDSYEIIEYKRQTPLEVTAEPFALGDAVGGDALVAFSKKRVLELSKLFQEKGVKNSVIYGDLPPEVRRMQYRAFIEGKSKILITTDAIGMGVNLPIRRIVFMSQSKFDGEEIRFLTSQEVKQIAGRAGRKGIYDTGYMCSYSGDWQFLKHSLEMQDEMPSRAVLGPSEAIIRIGGLPLREKLALWSTRRERHKQYRKMDVRDYLLILDSIRHYRLPEAAEYRLMNLPFDVNDPELLQCFIGYVEEHFKRGQSKISKPKASSEQLFDLEKYYQMLNLYYSFSKNFDLDFDPGWVYKERGKVSSRINRLLLKL